MDNYNAVRGDPQSKDWVGNMNSIYRTLGASNHTENKSEQHEVLEDYQTKMMLQQRQQEKEVMRIESNSNIHINSRREKSRGNQVI